MPCRGLHGFANPPYLGRFPFSALHGVAPYCVPGGIRVVSGEVRSLWITRRRFVCKPDCQMRGGPPNRRGEAPTRDFHLRLRFPSPFTRADIRAGLTHVVLTTMHKTGDYGRFWPCRTGPMHDPASGLRRIYLPRTRVNKVGGCPRLRYAVRTNRRTRRRPRMYAAWYERCGPANEVLTLGEMEAPRPGPGEVLVRLRASGINPGDAKKRADWMGFGMGYARVIPHSDGAGTIEEVGAGVAPCRIGEQVWVWAAQSGRPFGTAAEYVALPGEQAVTSRRAWKPGCCARASPSACRSYASQRHTRRSRTLFFAEGDR